MAKHTPAIELADATPLPATFDIKASTRREKSARVAVVPASSVTPAAGGVPDYAALGIPAKAVLALEAARAWPHSGG